MRALLLVTALVLAGCATPQEAPDAPAAAAARTIAFGGCEQTHTFVPYPMEAFAGMLPGGWALQPTDPAGRTTQFYYAGSRCATTNVTSANGTIEMGEGKEVWGYLFVIPPEGANETLDGELWPLGGVVSHGDLLRAYESWGFVDVVVQGETDLTIDTPAPGALSSRTWAANEEERFEVTATARHEEAAFHDGTFRVWIPADDEDGIAGAFTYAWPEGTELGLGSGTLRYDGPLLNAPPATPAVVHHVRDVSVTVARAE